MEVRSILFPVDSSARCYAAVPCVAAMARLFDASIYLLRPAKDPPPDLNFEGLRVVPAIRYGDADDEITNFATTRHIGMIMMATYSQEVFSNARCPVWMAAVRNEAAPPREPEIRSLLCAIDLGLQSRLLVRAAEFVGERAEAKVRLVYAVAGEENEIAPGAAIGFERYIKDCARVSVARLQHETGTSFDLCMETGWPSRVIAAAARHPEADLVIMGRGDTDAYSILRDCPCPVLRV